MFEPKSITFIFTRIVIKLFTANRITPMKASRVKVFNFIVFLF